MTLDELIFELSARFKDEEVQKLCQHLKDWKNSDDDIAALEDMAERYLGSVWVEDEKTHNQVYALCSEFRDCEIRSIGGKTMNERLYSFSLLEKFDQAQNETMKHKLYVKLMAT